MNRPELEAEVKRSSSLPFQRIIRGDDVDGYLAEAPELPGCITAGANPMEANVMLQDAIEGWIGAALKAGENVPEPAAIRVSG